MALDYAGTAALMSDASFSQRTQIACLHYASYISGEDRSVAAHNTRLKWASQVFTAPNIAAAQIMPVLVMDQKVQDAGAAITDPDLQSAVEASVNSML